MCHDRPVRVVVVEDDSSLIGPIEEALVRHGFDVRVVAYATQVIPEVQAFDPDCLLLDLGLPDGDGIDVLRELRRVSDVPVIITTARGDEADRVVGLELGADDYVVKPYSVRELAARIRAISRRRRVEPKAGNSAVTIDRSRRDVVVNGEHVELTAKEFDLLAVLAEDPGRVVPRQELFSRVWDPVWFGSGKTLDVHIGALRRKLGDPALIETVRGVGYRLADR